MALLRCTERMTNEFGLSLAVSFDVPSPILLRSNARMVNWLATRWETVPSMNTSHTSNTCSRRQAGIVLQEGPCFSSSEDWIVESTYKFCKRSLCQRKLWTPGKRQPEKRLNVRHLLMPVLGHGSFGRTGRTKEISVVIAKGVGGAVDQNRKLKGTPMPWTWTPYISKG